MKPDDYRIIIGKCEEEKYELFRQLENLGATLNATTRSYENIIKDGSKANKELIDRISDYKIEINTLKSSNQELVKQMGILMGKE